MRRVPPTASKAPVITHCLPAFPHRTSSCKTCPPQTSYHCQQPLPQQDATRAALLMQLCTPRPRNLSHVPGECNNAKLSTHTSATPAGGARPQPIMMRNSSPPILIPCTRTRRATLSSSAHRCLRIVATLPLPTFATKPSSYPLSSNFARTGDRIVIDGVGAYFVHSAVLNKPRTSCHSRPSSHVLRSVMG